MRKRTSSTQHSIKVTFKLISGRELDEVTVPYGSTLASTVQQKLENTLQDEFGHLLDFSMSIGDVGYDREAWSKIKLRHDTIVYVIVRLLGPPTLRRYDRIAALLGHPRHIKKSRNLSFDLG